MTTRTTHIFLPLDAINTMFALPCSKTPALLVSMDRDAYQHPEVRVTADLQDSLVSCTFSTIAAPNNRDIRPFYLTNPEAWAGAKGFAPKRYATPHHYGQARAYRYQGNAAYPV